MIPPIDFRGKVINLAHEGHLGRSLTKARVRERYWWPGMDHMTKDVVKDCMSCASNDKSHITNHVPLSPVEVPDAVWSKLGLDIIGPFKLMPSYERFVLLLVDYTSKWVVMKCVSVTCYQY